jgi:hypothetical protein
MLRFNEAINQALAESIASFTARVTRSRNLLLGMWRQDLRSPLQTILVTAKLLRGSNADGEAGLAAERPVRKADFALVECLCENDHNRCALRRMCPRGGARARDSAVLPRARQVTLDDLELGTFPNGLARAAVCSPRTGRRTERCGDTPPYTCGQCYALLTHMFLGAGAMLWQNPSMSTGG